MKTFKLIKALQLASILQQKATFSQMNLMRTIPLKIENTMFYYYLKEIAIKLVKTVKIAKHD